MNHRQRKEGQFTATNEKTLIKEKMTNFVSRVYGSTFILQ